MDNDTEKPGWYSVVKLNPHGKETWRYSGRLVCQDDHSFKLEAFFNREDIQIHGMLLAKGDRFLETYFTDRWYNIFEIYAHDDHHLRGWYCNIATPVQVTGEELSYIDLALDLIVFPDGLQIILDEDEFELLEISPDLREKAYHALQDLQKSFEKLAGKQPGE